MLKDSLTAELVGGVTTTQPAFRKQGLGEVHIIAIKGWKTSLATRMWGNLLMSYFFDSAGALQKCNQSAPPLGPAVT